MSAAKTTTNHDVIRKWAEQRGGRPAAVAATHKDDEGGLLRIDFGEKEDTLDEISWLNSAALCPSEQTLAPRMIQPVEREQQIEVDHLDAVAHMLNI